MKIKINRIMFQISILKFSHLNVIVLKCNSNYSKITISTSSGKWSLNNSKTWMKYLCCWIWGFSKCHKNNFRSLLKNVLKARGYVDRVPGHRFFLFAKRASVCDEF